MTIELYCADCGANLARVREGVRGPMRCEECRKLHARHLDLARMKAGCEREKVRRRELRDPNCRGCDQPLVFDDSGERMDMKIYCSPCLMKRKRSQDSRRFGCKPMSEIKREAEERRAAKAAAKAMQRAERQRALEAKRRECPWLNPKLTDTQAYRLQYKLDADFRAREIARSVQRRKVTPLLRTWENMIARCENPNVKGYHRYGGRGIKCMEPFRSSFQAFVDHVAQLGPRPTPRHSIDRIDPDGHYAIGNLRWADDPTQANNKSKVKTTPAMLAAAMRARMDRRKQQAERKAQADRELQFVVAVGQR